ncbi:hypothetical protein [Mucilaginibacter jinjuensis]|uniref:FlgD-like protein n=1 Tax=Mucilaginibacter jinjuensis TaxID=1176721 RepID=A0ABY7TBM0_9SPHI|nr:hypothetical protein [Mucilaginibacter jinjuensis]WCT13846.1 hypothetical protein PQO05_07865 [Mucilaginibacter jinjuensis]
MLNYKSFFITLSRSAFHISTLIISFVFLNFNVCVAQTNGANRTFSFSLAQGAKTSAGVFAKDSTLIRTLWSGTYFDAGHHSADWDGKDDEGLPAKPGTYIVKVLSNNVKYKWEGVIGNTSDSLSGPSVMHSMDALNSIAIANGVAYYTTHYNEQNTATFKFNVDNPYSKQAILNKGITALFVATDGKTVYWAGNDANIDSNSFVYGTYCSNDAEANFEFGQIVKTKYARTFQSAIDVIKKNGSTITGLAVQTRSSFLFVTHQKLNTIDVLNKTNGFIVKSVHIDSPGLITIDNDNNLWLRYNAKGRRVIGKFKVGKDGDLINTNIVIQNIENPVAMAVSPDNRILLVADAGNSQQLKAFDISNAALKWTYGKKGGYYETPDVSNDKFYFSDKRGEFSSTIAFEANGSFWVEDAGNCRLQHYSNNLTFINNLMFLSRSYSMAVDFNNPTRIFSDYLEFKIDYTKPLKPRNNSWTLVKNWGANIPASLDDKYKRMHSVVTLNNGHTYFTIFDNKNKDWLIAELPKKGNLRISNTVLGNINSQLYPDGSVRTEVLTSNQQAAWKKRELKGFDSDNNPLWGDDQILLSLTIRNGDPIKRTNLNIYHAADITQSNILVVYDNTRADTNLPNWHLGGIKLGQNKWFWKTAIGTPANYKGIYPLDGAFDNRNTHYSGSVTLLMTKNIFWGYYGEGWQGTQVNKWNHIYDNGLFVGQFGVTGLDNKNIEAPPMMAGNAFSAAIIKTNTNEVYLYHNDESYHSGIHRWKIINLDSIKEQNIKISL